MIPWRKFEIGMHTNGYISREGMPVFEWVWPTGRTAPVEPEGDAPRTGRQEQLGEVTSGIQ